MTISAGLVTIAMWIGLAAFGAIVSLVNIRDARKDHTYQARSTVRSRERLLIARVNMANEIMRCVVLVLLLVSGILVASVQFAPDPPPASLYVRCVILLTIATLVTKTLLHRWLRRELTERRSS